ncbi:MAG: ATP-dependent DNA helicase RecG [Anaerolineae bacterium]
MPSALETLVKILKLEREQGYKNTVMMGGLGGQYSENWEHQAVSQARKAEHFLLIEEITSKLHAYERAQTKEERHALVTYMLDRITNRAPMPESYKARIPEMEARLTSQLPATVIPQEKTDDPADQQRPNRETRPPREDRRGRERREPRAAQADEGPSSPAEAQQGERPNRPPREERRPRDQQHGDREQGEQGIGRENREPRQNRPPRGDRRPVIAAPPHESNADAPAPTDAMPDEYMNTLSELPTPVSPEVAASRATSPAEPSQREGRDKHKDKGRKEKDKRPAIAKPPKGGKEHRDEMPDTVGDGTMNADDDFSSLDDVYAGARGPVKMDIPVPPKLARPPRIPRPSRSPQDAADMLRMLGDPVDRIKGIGPQKAKNLAALGILTVKDLLYFLPRRYDDYTRCAYISRLEENQRVTVIGTVTQAEIRIGKSGRKDFYIVVSDSSASMGVTFFGQFFLQKQIRVHQQIVLHGETTLFNGRIQMTNPEWDDLDVEDLQNVRIVPVYPLTEGVTNRSLRATLQSALGYWAERIPDYVPESVLDRTELADLGWTLRNIHFPESDDHLIHARRRFIFDELLLLQLAILGNRRQWQLTPSIPLELEEEDIAVFAGAVFPYLLTNAQTRAIDDIRRDVAKTIPMNRLLQGDVGAGKTAVAVSAIGMALMRGKQSALMAPTSILAEQHYKNISRALSLTPQDALPFDRRPQVALLTGSISEADRQSIYQGLADGSIDVVIGTHAIIQEGVEFHELALAIIDEQHRFGVEQRGALRGKGQNPHILAMTATPIPRTLALTLYADLDLSILNEMPPGRIPIKTAIIPPSQRERAYEGIENELKEGHQAFIVYPLVEESEAITEAKAAVQEYERLQGVFHRFNVGLLHGRMRPAEKDQVMADFRDHKFDVLVTTSVAEVGVDIPDATVIMIEGANRFGLAQLHQFRGRVGRSGLPSYCLLISDTSEQTSIDRLKIVRDNADGFKLAEEDFRQRGAGDLIGTRQSGQGSSRLQLAALMTPELVELAQREARTLYEEDPDLVLPEHSLLSERVNMLKNERADVS